MSTVDYILTSNPLDTMVFPLNAVDGLPWDSFLATYGWFNITTVFHGTAGLIGLALHISIYLASWSFLFRGELKYGIAGLGLSLWLGSLVTHYAFGGPVGVALSLFLPEHVLLVIQNTLYYTATIHGIAMYF
ncbi:hypothetical protein A3709_19600 [Halioglobus sp. HI00S01]|uniref:hypothetical protein n=1 Tax=Halioglobus sp. HI00S01 TaxID=1822214 RepID=UPI0007C2D466|nr:hypothetical protein [Halioglobus sp. HI00S01]KZX57831.1 hypothetical protein A3709_19600 [Halioglobus sp. HI00S01]